MFRKVDELGRVVLPVEIRNTLDIHPKDKMEISLDQNKIILKKHQPKLTCQISGEHSQDNLTLADGKIVLSPTSAKLLLKEIESLLHDN